MRELDHQAIEEFNIPGDALMERAGKGVAEIAMPILNTRMGNTVLLIAGTGNNGGDVFAAATFLAEADVNVIVWICGSKQNIKGDAEYHLNKMIRRGIHPVEMSQAKDLNLQCIPVVIVDGLLGTGAKGAPRGFMNEVIHFINHEAHRSFILSIDIPTGVNADTGIAAGHAVRANLTATMELPKNGLIRPEALPYVGNVEIIHIGIPPELKLLAPDNAEAELIDRSDLHIPARNNEAHKGDYGHVLLIGGSAGMSGAIALAAQAALRSGAGRVSVLTPEEVYPIVAQTAGPEVMVHAFHHGTSRSKDARFLSLLEQCDVLCVGPGMGRTDETKSFVEHLLRTCRIPLLLDADALCVSPEQIAKADGPVIITPHPGEFERLFGEPVTDRWAQARAAAEKIRQTVVLKGAGTVVAHPEYKLGINLTGNPGMATAGSGDVLAGILTALIGRGMDPFQAALAGVHLHGLAGDLAAEKMTQEAMIATDIIQALPDAFRIIQLS